MGFGSVPRIVERKYDEEIRRLEKRIKDKDTMLENCLKVFKSSHMTAEGEAKELIAMYIRDLNKAIQA